jgi:hypothetical protein
MTAMMSHVAFAVADPDERDGPRESDSPYERTKRQAARKMLTIQPRQYPQADTHLKHRLRDRVPVFSVVHRLWPRTSVQRRAPLLYYSLQHLAPQAGAGS